LAARLYLIPNLLSAENIHKSIPLYNQEIIRNLKHFIVENPKPARHLLKAAGVKTPFEDIYFYEFNEHTRESELSDIIKPLIDGNDMGLISDAGYPAIADPGEKIVKIAQQKHFKVVPLSGPSSIFMTLAASGLNAEQFSFHAYLPIKKPDRIKQILELEAISFKTGYSQIFIEAPYRSQYLFEDIISCCKSETVLSIAVELMSEHEFIQSKSISQWKKSKLDLKNKRVVFVIGS